MEQSSTSDLECSLHAASSLNKVENSDFLFEKPQLCTVNESHTTVTNSSTDLCHRSGKTSSIFSADELTNISLNELRKEPTCDQLSLSESPVVKWGLSASDIQKKPIESENPFECSDSCLDENCSVAGLNIDPSTSLPPHDTDVTNQPGSSGCTIDEVVVLGVWEGSPQSDDDGAYEQPVDNISSDNSFYVELTEDEEERISSLSEKYHLSAGDHLNDLEPNSACSKKSDCLKNEKVVEEVGKVSLSSKDQLKTDLDEHHCLDIINSEVTVVIPSDTVVEMCCEAQVSEVHQSSSPTEKFYNPDEEVLAKLSGELQCLTAAALDKEEVGKTSISSNDQLETGLDKPHCKDRIDAEVVDMVLGDEVIEKPCEAPISEIDSLTSPADKLYSADEDAVAKSSVELPLTAAALDKGEVWKTSISSNDQLETGLDKPHCKEVIDAEVVDMVPGDEVIEKPCEAPISEIDSLTSPTDKLYSADEDAVAKSSVELPLTAAAMDKEEVGKISINNNDQLETGLDKPHCKEVIDAEVVIGDKVIEKRCEAPISETDSLTSPTDKLYSADEDAVAKSSVAISENCCFDNTQLGDTGFSPAELSGGNHRCSSPLELAIPHSGSVKHASEDSSSVSKPSSMSASRINLVTDIAVSEVALPSQYLDSVVSTISNSIAKSKSDAGSLLFVSTANQNDHNKIVVKSDQVASKRSSTNEKPLHRTKEPRNVSPNIREVHAVSIADAGTTGTISNVSHSTGSHLMSSTRENDVSIPMDFSVRGSTAAARSDVIADISSFPTINMNRNAVGPVKDKASNNHTVNSMTELPCDLRLKRKLPNSFVEVPVKKEKQDNSYEQQQTMSSSTIPVTCVSNRLLKSGLNLPLTNVCASSTFSAPCAKLNQVLPVQTSITGSGEQNRCMTKVILSRSCAGNPQQRFAAGTSLGFSDMPVTTVQTTMSSHCSFFRPQTLQPGSFASGLKSRSSVPAVITHTNIRQQFSHIALPVSSSVAQAVTRKVKSHFGRSFAKKYVAPINAPPDLFLPPLRRFICSGCGDEYVTLAGMQSHLGRRSMYLEFQCTCNIQKWPQIFYNPCSLASFYKAHKRRPGSHSSLDTFTASVLRENTPEYIQLCEEKKRQKEAEAAASKERLLQEKLAKRQRKDINKPQKTVHNVQLGGSKESVDRNLQHIRISQNSTVSSHFQGVTSESIVAERSHEKNEAQEMIILGDVRQDTTLGVENFFEVLSHHKTTCCGCGEMHKSRQALASHYTHQKVIEVDEHVCSKCRMSLPSLCAHIAHQRIHDQMKPFVCPECGVLFDQAESFEVFRQHVERVCLHFARSPAPFDKCSRCMAQVLGGDAKSMACHMIDAHTITYHKCQACPMAFGTAAAAERHSSNTGHNARHRVVRKCPTCDAVFESTSSPDIYAHVENHLTSLTLQCSFCTTRFASHSQIMDHVRSVHSGEAFLNDVCEVCGKSFASNQLLYDHIVTNHSKYHKSILSEALSASNATAVCSKSSHKKSSSVQKTITAATTPKVKSDSVGSNYECVRCQMQFQTKELYSRHQAKHRFLENKKEAKKVIAQDDLSEEQARSGKIKQISTPQIVHHVSCTLCHLKFPDRAELEKHKFSDHGISNYHVCYLCADCFETSDALSHHISSRHTGKVLVHAFVCPICKDSSDSTPRSFPQQGQLTKHLHTVHRMSREEATRRSRAATHADDAVKSGQTSSESADSVAVVKKLYVRGESESYLCAECGFSTADRVEFAAHVTVTHPPVPADAVQCMECSQSFPVAPALERHLRLVHRIVENVDRYLTKNGRAPVAEVFDDEVPADTVYRADPKISTPISTFSTPIKDTANTNPATADDNCSPRECNVCYRLFFSFDQLRAHMRVHGMAFIQGTRRKLTDSK